MERKRASFEKQPTQELEWTCMTGSCCWNSGPCQRDTFPWLSSVNTDLLSGAKAGAALSLIRNGT